MSASPSNKTLPAETYALGSPLADYPDQNDITVGLGAIVLGVVLSLLLWFLYAVVGIIPYILFLAPLLIPVGAFLVVRGLIEGRKHALVFTDGLAEVKRSKTTIMRWDDIVSVNQKIVSKRNRKGTETGRNYTYTVQDKNGQKLVFGSSYSKNVEALGKTIQQEVSKRLYPRYIEALNKGETVAFGNLSLNKSGLSNGTTTLPWSEVEGVKLNQGYLTVLWKGVWASLARQTAAMTPNLFVFLSMVDQLVAANKPKSS